MKRTYDTLIALVKVISFANLILIVISARIWGLTDLRMIMILLTALVLFCASFARWKQR